MAVDCGALRTGIAARLATITGLYEHDVQPETAQRWPVAIVFPMPPPGGRHTTDMCNGEFWRFVVEIHVQRSQGLERAQRELDAYISTTGARSIKVALEGDDTLAAAVDTLEVMAFDFYGYSQFNGHDTLCARVPVECYT